MNINFAIISAYLTTSTAIQKELEEALGFNLNINKFEIDEKSKNTLDLNNFQETTKILNKFSLILCSSQDIYDSVKTFIPSATTIVITKRIVNISMLTELLSLEFGTKVSVFGSNKKTSKALIDELNRTGIDHLEFFPFYPQSNFNSENIVITPGKTIPSMYKSKRIIDVSYRTLSLTTISEVLVHLGMYKELLPIIEARYSKEIYTLTKYNALTNKHIKGILEVSSEGILCVDENGISQLFNSAFMHLTNMDIYDILGKNYLDIPFSDSLKNLVTSDEPVLYRLIEYKSKKLLVTKHIGGQYASSFVLSIQDVTQIQEIETTLRKELTEKGFIAKHSWKDLVGESTIIKNTISDSQKVAKSDFTVLIQGENGTGKEMFAQAIHNNSTRSKAPFVAVNLASLSDSIIESELFGYEEGSFTGALKGGKAGLFEMAHNGTIFIDEIGDISLQIQQRLLRILQEKEVMRVGGNKILPINVRVIAATNRNLLELVEQGQFRMDLYYRLNVLRINIPALRERCDDIPLFFNHFLKEINSCKTISLEAMKLLCNYSWKGNVRELQNIVYYLETLCEHDKILSSDLPVEFHTTSQNINIFSEIITTPTKVFSPLGAKEEAEIIFILKTLKEAKLYNKKLGRKSISKISLSTPTPLTIEQLRKRFKLMNDLELISIGTTKQASQITQKGELFLKNL